MPRQLKTPIEKFKTKINNLISDDRRIKDLRQQIKVAGKVLFSYNIEIIKYTRNRYFPSKIESLVEEDFEVHFPMTGENLKLLGANIANPPRGAKLIIDLIRKNSNQNINKIIIGAPSNLITNRDLHVTKEFYETITKINKEEGKDRAIRFSNRTRPFLQSNFNVISAIQTIDRDYSLLLEEIIASGQLSQQDIIELTNKLDEGNNINVVVEKQIIKQAEWLIEKVQEIVDEGKLNVQRAKELGNKHFGFPKSTVKGPEHLMEKILTSVMLTFN